MQPKTTLLPVWPRDVKSLDTPSIGFGTLASSQLSANSRFNLPHPWPFTNTYFYVILNVYITEWPTHLIHSQPEWQKTPLLKQSSVHRTHRRAQVSPVKWNTNTLPITSTKTKLLSKYCVKNKAELWTLDFLKNESIFYNYLAWHNQWESSILVPWLDHGVRDTHECDGLNKREG